MDINFYFWASIIAILLVISGFFSGSETALTAASRAKLRAKVDKGNRASARALKLTDNNERLIGALLLGNNMVNILAASLATTLFTQIFAENGVAISTIFMTIFVLIFSEVLPKTYAISKPEEVAESVSFVLIFVVRALAPIVSLVQTCVRGILWAVGQPIDPTRHVLAIHEEIEGAINLGHSEGLVGKEHRDRMLGALQLANKTVKDIMVHRSQIEMVDIEWDNSKIVDKVISSRHTRIPIFKNDSENIIGLLHSKNVLKALKHNIKKANGTKSKIDFEKISSTPYFIPEHTNLDNQMREFLSRRVHFALVVDEYGVLQGLLTLEDIIEEIVGDITDEFDIAKSTVKRKATNGDFLIDGSTPVRELNREYNWSLPEMEAVTIAGFVIDQARMIPTEGQVFYFSGYRFEVISREGNRLTLFKVRSLKKIKDT